MVKIAGMQLAIAQLNQVVGDLPANARGILAAVAEGEAAGASLVVTPELSLCGYPPEDLLLRPPSSRHASPSSQRSPRK